MSKSGGVFQIDDVTRTLSKGGAPGVPPIQVQTPHTHTPGWLATGLGWVDAYPIPQKTQKLVEACIFNEFIPRYGAPEMIITDQGLEFKEKVLADSLERLKISHKRATPYHPEANGRLERAHRTLKNVLRKLVNNRSAEWEEQLGAALWAHRVTRGPNGFTPFQLQYGREPRVPLKGIAT